MRLLLRTAALSLMMSLALVAGAQAADHVMHVTEVYPSASDPGMAFVELQDTASEPFPAPGYALASLDASGAELGRQVFTPPYGFASNAQPFLVAADGRPTRDAALTIPLAGARKVCFYRGVNTKEVIHCLTFDTPPEGQSAQLTSTDAVVSACPTPDAANKQAAGPCAGVTPPPTVGSDPTTAPAPGATPPAPAAAPAADLRAPTLRLSARRLQRLGQLRLSVLVDERATVTVTGTGLAAGRKFALIKLRRVCAAGTRTVLRPKLTRAGTEAVRRAVKRGTRPVATVKIVARDSAGNVTTKRLKITLTS